MESTQTTRLPGGAAPAVDEVDLTQVRNYWQLVRQRLMRHRLAVMAFFLMTILVTMAIVIPILSANAWAETSLERINQPPSLLAPLGYDNLGINTFARLMKGLQTSLFIGFSAVVVIVLIGVTVGAMAGYFGGWADNALMRFVDVVLSIPTFFLILMLVAFWGTGNRGDHHRHRVDRLDDAARLVRPSSSAREADFVQAAKALGAGDRRIVVRHMIPSAMAPASSRPPWASPTRSSRRHSVPRLRDHATGGEPRQHADEGPGLLLSRSSGLVSREYPRPPCSLRASSATACVTRSTRDSVVQADGAPPIRRGSPRHRGLRTHFFTRTGWSRPSTE
jgi:ABC-type dipeptide/oligopeptide/nickel transport system permease subunit